MQTTDKNKLGKENLFKKVFYILYINRLKNATEEEINGWNPCFVILTTNL